MPPITKLTEGIFPPALLEWEAKRLHAQVKTALGAEAGTSVSCT